MKSSDFSGILTQGGTILGTSRQPFKLMRTPDENGLDKVEAMKHTYKKLKLSCLVVLGGNGSQKTATATQCPYCDNYVIVDDQISGAYTCLLYTSNRYAR